MDISTVAIFAVRDQVVAVVQFIVGVLENG